MPDTMTLPQYADTLPKGSLDRALVEVFAASSDIMGVLPFAGFSGPSYEFYRQAELNDTMAFRAINAPGTTGMGTLEPFSEASFLLDHDIDFDIGLIRRGQNRAKYDAMGMAEAGRLWAQTFMTGDNTSNNKEFNGIKARCTAASGRLYHNSPSSGGGPLSLGALDVMLNDVSGVTHLIAPRSFIPRLTAAARTPSVSGNIFMTDWNQVGKPKVTYAGIPMLFGYEREPIGDLLDFNEVASGGGSAVTASIYAVMFGENGVHGIQLKSLESKNAGLLEDQITERTHISWDVGLVDEHPYSLARLDSITNAAIVA